uniref:Uncharacterized protein n=1 Tax=Anguilla anguilla TaxID=7936 RepID=A0A0E9TKZ0_ANGAN
MPQALCAYDYHNAGLSTMQLSYYKMEVLLDTNMKGWISVNLTVLRGYHPLSHTAVLQNVYFLQDKVR